MNQAFRQDDQVERVVSDGAVWVAIWRSAATHVGPMPGVAPTGKTITVAGITAYEIREGLLAAYWEQFDALTILTALGIAPPLGQ